MSHVALRRVVIRLLHDPAFVAALARDPEGALAGVALSADERAWLAATPPAAWLTDPARPARVLAALVEEYPATLALVPRARAEGFCASPAFHAAVQERGSLALAFADHLAGTDGEPVRSIVALERAIAAVRRGGAAAVPPGWIRLAPRAAVVRVANGALDLLAALRAGDPAPPLARGAVAEPALVVAPRGSGEATIEPLAEGLAAILERAAGGCPRGALLREVRSHGAEPGEDEEIVRGLVADGILILGV